ncbi:nose resistant to fluoxetine protein 6-like [Penaeus indicus]|uniref:nose resistant to fluoxetine protein 6-like n=1 Tax=Penaeus indicus TaxID=29960 RepID=UPI00300CBB1F
MTTRFSLLLLVQALAMGVSAAVSIPAHSSHIVTTFRWMLGKYYYPTPSASHGVKLDVSSSLCLAHSALTLASDQRWSLSMWDASGKMTDGVAAGATEARGHAGLCKRVSADFPGTVASHLHAHRDNMTRHDLALNYLNSDALLLENTVLKGRYCLVSVRDQNLSGKSAGGSSQMFASLAGKYGNTYATCIPDTCTAALLQTSLRDQWEEDIVVSVACEGEEEDYFSLLDFGFLAFTLVLVILVVWATALDLQQPCDKTTGCFCTSGRKMLHCFSLVQNGPRILSVPVTPNQHQTLDGLRVVSMAWVILAHRYMLFLVSASNPNDILQHMTNWRYWWVFNAYPSVDTFFFISAFLVSVYLKERLHNFTFTGFYVQRYLRLVPTMLYTVWGCGTVLRHLGSGLVWDRTYQDMFGQPCTSSAWYNLLFINNFNDSGDMCLGHLWSLAVEWQFFLVTPLILIPLYRWPTWRFRWLPLVLTLILSIVAPAAITISKDLPPTASFWEHQSTQMYYNHIYMAPWCRAGPYCVGLAAGWLYHWMTENSITLKPTWIRAGKIISFVVVAGVLTGPSFLIGQGRFWAALYSSLSRPAWGCVIAFFVLNTARGKPGVIAHFFSHPMLAPLCKVSYCMYLVSLPLQTMTTGMAHKNHYDQLTAVYLVVGDLVFSYGASLVLALLVESPCTRLLSLLTSGKLLQRSQPPKPQAKTSVKEAPKRPSNTQELVRATLAPTFSCVRYRNL